jgi:uncharacterized membrane protein
VVKVSFYAKHSDIGTSVLKPDVASIVGGLLAISSLAFPWWTVSVVFQLMGIDRPGYMSLYLYRVDTSALGWSRSSQLNLSFGWITLALVVSASLLGILGGLLRRIRSARAFYPTNQVPGRSRALGVKASNSLEISQKN